MRQITITADTIKKIKDYFECYDEFDELDPFDSEENWVSVEGAEFKQGDDTIFVDGNVHAHYDKCINDTYGGYEDNCSEWVNDQHEIYSLDAYDKEGDEVDITNASDVLKSA